MSFFTKFFTVILFVAGFSLSSTAQILPPDDDDVQSWNDIQLTIPVSKKVDLSLTTTYRFGENLSRFNEGRVGAGIGVKLHKSFTATAGYTFIKSRTLTGRFRRENRYHLAGTYKFPFKKFGLSHRSQYEYRDLGPIKVWRYRPSITFEKALPQSWLSKTSFFVTEEPFYSSATGNFARNRLSLGLKKTFNRHFSLDVYFLRQNDRFSIPGDVNVIGTAWKFSL